MKYIPKSVTCLQFSTQRYRRHPRCRHVFKECCEYMQLHYQRPDLILGRQEWGADFDEAPSLVRSYFPESWMWEVQRVSPGVHSAIRPLPDSLTTWQVRAVGMFQNGICVADPVHVSVSLPLSVDVPLPYQVIRGEQLELKGSVYNRLDDDIQYCVTLTAGPAVCLLESAPVPGGSGLHSTACSWSPMSGGDVRKVTFNLLGLEPGEHKLTFTLRTRTGIRDSVEKTLRVVPEGQRKEELSGGRLDPQGLYGSEKRSVELKNRVPSNIVPNTAVERMLTINGEVVVDFLSVVHSPEGLRQLVNLPAGSALAESLSWLIRRTQKGDGSFQEKATYIPNKIMAEGTDPVDQSVYLTSFVLIALHKATRIKDPLLQLRFHYDSMTSAADYISQHAEGVKSVYVRAIATYALTLHDANTLSVTKLLTSLEKLAKQKGSPAELRFWQEPEVKADWIKPDQSSSLTVETTAYVMLTVLLKGRVQYANPILSWLTQDQHYGEGFYSMQDTVLTLEAVTEYSRVAARSTLFQEINIRYRTKGNLAQVTVTQKRPVATPIQVTQDDGITVTTGFGKGVSNVKMKTVYYATTSSSERCNFDVTIEVMGPGASASPGMRTPHLVACAKYKPPPNELVTESTMTVMKIQLPTGVEAYLEDLRQFRDSDEPVISHYELQGTTVVIQMETVPADIFLCVGFRVRTSFRVTGTSESVLTVYEPQDKGSMCTKRFSYEEQKLQRLCVGDQCQCMTAACAAYRGDFDLTLTAARRVEETCRPHIKYAFRVQVKSSVAEGDFMTYTATVVEVLKIHTDFDAVRPQTEVFLVKKATCSAVQVQTDRQYLLLGARGTEVKIDGVARYRLPLDSEALLEQWPTDSDCSSPECKDYVSQLADFALHLQMLGC